MNCTIEDLYKSFRTKLKNFVNSRVNDEELANDLVQEIFIKLNNYCNNNGYCSYPKSYLYKIAINTILDHYRSKQYKLSKATERIDDVVLNDDLYKENNDNKNKISIECLTPLIDNLPSPYKETLKLADIEHIPQKTIAKKMNVSISCIKTRIQRGRMKLKDLILKICKIEHDKYGNIIQCDPHS